MMDITITIPSYKRAQRLVGLDYFPTAVYVVPESQKDEYLRATMDEARVVAVPDDIDGNIARKRNWILDHFPRPLVMIDDDVKAICHTEGLYDESGRFSGRVRHNIRLTPEEAIEFFAMAFNLAAEWGCVVWGVNVNTDSMNYQQYKPFSLTQAICGPLTAHLDHAIRYDERFRTKDDFDFALQVLNKYHKALRFNKFSYDADHGDNKGGIVSYRTFDMEIEESRLIERKWGRNIIAYPLKPKKKTDLLNPAHFKVPIRGV